MIFNNTDWRYYIFVPQKIALILQSGKDLVRMNRQEWAYILASHIFQKEVKTR
ncbi:unknown [Prevotella sp. CAG:487]|nr:unknown [Prevotella sp. CAG:487]